ncbi:hydrogenase maturation nickel metallochaperone HypA [Archaeoglobales archaeon]|nr:MAG: hydrogenase maturation nickel metallochaperone HypA [Archaeoglobales archaeon]
MSFATALLENVLSIAEEKNAKQVTKIKIEIGDLLLINPEQLEFCFEAVSNGTIAEGAELNIEFVPPKIKCSVCGREYNEVVGVCECGGFVGVDGGKEMIIRKVEMVV